MSSTSTSTALCFSYPPFFLWPHHSDSYCRGLDPADPTFAKASQTDVCGLHGDVVHRRHTIGEKDQYKESGEELVKLFSAPKVLMHADNHRPLPAKKAAALPLAQAMLDFINAKTAEA